MDFVVGLNWNGRTVVFLNVVSVCDPMKASRSISSRKPIWTAPSSILHIIESLGATKHAHPGCHAAPPLLSNACKYSTQNIDTHNTDLHQDLAQCEDVSSLQHLHVSAP